MDLNEMAKEIADRLLLREAENKALKDVIESRPDAPKGAQLASKLLDLQSRIQNNQKYRERVEELHRAFDAHTDAAELIRTLHSEILSNTPIPFD